jgi:hypothetical protein
MGEGLSENFETNERQQQLVGLTIVIVFIHTQRYKPDTLIREDLKNAG